MVTIKDISLRCGVSSATVSKALNGSKEISEETAEYIRKVAREMGYLPNATAGLLKLSVPIIWVCCLSTRHKVAWRTNIFKNT